LLLAAGALLLPGRHRRGLALTGLVPLGLALAAMIVRLGPDFSNLSLRVAERGAPVLFLRVNTGLLLLGLGLIAGAALVAALRDPRLVPSWVGFILVGAGTVPALAPLFPLLGYIGWVPTLGVSVGIAASAVTIFLLFRRLRIGRAIRWLDVRALDRSPSGLVPAFRTSFDHAWVTGFFAAGLVMCLTPSFRAFALATVVAATVGHVLLRRIGGGSPLPVSALLALFMIPVYRYLTAISGSSHPTFAELRDSPFSVAAEIRLVPWIALVAFGLAGLWPFHGRVFPLAAPLAGVILLRLGVDLLPAGWEHWAPLFMPILLLALWHGAVTLDDRRVERRRLIEILVALALFGLLANNEGSNGAYWLLGAAALVSWSTGLSYLPTVPWGLGRLVWLPLAWAAMLILTGGLRAQVTWSVLAAAAIAAALWIYHRDSPASR
jgi:hypothetical protein